MMRRKRKQLEPGLEVNEKNDAFLVDQLYEIINKTVSSSSPGTMLPSERALARDYEISHGTVRVVLNRLVEEKKIYKVPGKGSFVAAFRYDDESRRTIIYADPLYGQFHAFYSARLKGLLAAAEREGFRIQIVQHLGSSEIPVKEIGRPDVCAIIIPWMPPAKYREMKKANPDLCILSGLQPLGFAGTTSVTINLEAFGKQACEFLLNEGHKRVILVEHLMGSYQGLMSFNAMRDGVMDIVRINSFTSADARSVFFAVKDIQADAIVFEDDNVASFVISSMMAMDPEYLEKTRVVSSSNIGDDNLPEGVVKFEFDGHRIGEMMITIVEGMLKNHQFENMDIRLNPVLLEESV
jgi:DNA-binding transcriptional regulator YhcF (GntR family)